MGLTFRVTYVYNRNLVVGTTVLRNAIMVFQKGEWLLFLQQGTASNKEAGTEAYK